MYNILENLSEISEKYFEREDTRILTNRILGIVYTIFESVIHDSESSSDTFKGPLPELRDIK